MVICAALPRFQEVWTIPPDKCEANGAAWELAIKTIPAEQRSERLQKLIEGLPWINALATSAIVFIPRFLYTMQNFRNRRPIGPNGAPAAGAPIGDYIPPTEPPGRPPTVAPGESAIGGGGYQDDLGANEYADIDGSAAQA